MSRSVIEAHSAVELGLATNALQTVCRFGSLMAAHGVCDPWARAEHIARSFRSTMPAQVAELRPAIPWKESFWSLTLAKRNGLPLVKVGETATQFEGSELQAATPTLCAVTW